MFNRLAEIIKKRLVAVYFGLFFILLSVVYFPAFSYPQRSDWWSTAYLFHRIDTLVSGPVKWLYVFQFDSWGHSRFQPLSYLILYLEKSFFASNFVFYQLLNFFLYCLSIVLLYKLAVNFCKSKLLCAAFLTLFAFLFSHFDIICWSFHSYIIFGFCAFILGFILYINFLKSAKFPLLIFVYGLFLAGMFCYESFIFWPLAIIILSFIKDLREKQRIRENGWILPCLLVIGSVYASYFLIFLLLKIFNVYVNKWITIPLWHLFSIRAIFLSMLVVFFNIILNGLVVNAIPLLACPLVINENVCLGGLFFGAVGFTSANLILNIYYIAVLFGLVLLWRRRNFKVLYVLGFLAFLLYSELFVLFHSRRLTNSFDYIFTQPRYLYIPNALVILIALFLVDRFLNKSRRDRIKIYSVLALILMLNIYATERYGIATLNQQLTPLKTLFSNIKTSIKNGQITKERPIFIDDNIAKKLPSLSWNADMGKCCMRGTYQWSFSNAEINSFSSFREAKWVVNGRDLSIIEKKTDLEN